MKIITIAILAATIAFAGCTRIETGEVGLRLNASKQIEGAELLEGSWNQTLIGSVITVPVRDIPIQIVDLKPIAKNDTRLSDLDITVIYSINPAAVSDLWSKKSKSFHSKIDGDWMLMHSYLSTVVNNSVQKAIRAEDALTVIDKRADIELAINTIIRDELTKEKLDTSILISSVRIQNISPNQSIVDAATATIRANQQVATAEANVRLAEKESERMAKLASNAEKSIAYMDAQSRQMIATAILNGKVNTIVIPNDFKGIVNVK